MQIELWDELTAIQRRMDDLFREFLGPRARISFPALPTGLRRPFAPVTDEYEMDGKRIIRVELPGIDPEKDVSVALEEGFVVVRGQRAKREEIKDEEYYRMESSYGTFERYFSVPDTVKEQDLQAEYADGILTIVVPAVTEKGAKVTTHPIPIRTVKARKEKAA